MDSYIKYYRSSDLRLHRDTMHAGEKKYKCKDCGKLFSQKGSLNRHMAQVLQTFLDLFLGFTTYSIPSLFCDSTRDSIP